MYSVRHIDVILENLGTCEGQAVVFLVFVSLYMVDITEYILGVLGGTE